MYKFKTGSITNILLAVFIIKCVRIIPPHTITLFKLYTFIIAERISISLNAGTENQVVICVTQKKMSASYSFLTNKYTCLC